MKRLTAILPLSTLLVGTAWAAPQPSVAPKSWQLEFEFHDPVRISLTLPGESAPTTFWYVLYSVTNQTGREAPFYPTFHLVTDTLQILEAGEGIDPVVFDAVRARHQKLHPFFVDPADIYGPLKQGVDNRLTSAAVFRDFDSEASSFTIYVAGLSGEIVSLANPSFDPLREESDNNQRFFILRKTLAIHYDFPGDSRTRVRAVPARVKRAWTMR